MLSMQSTVLRHPWRVVALWVLFTVAATVFAVRLPDAVRGGSDAIEDSPSGRTTQSVERHFGPGATFLFTVVVEAERIALDDPRFPAHVEAIARSLGAVPGVSAVDHYWNTGTGELRGRDGRSALLLVHPRTSVFREAEQLTGDLRAALANAPAQPGFSAAVTGMPALFHDLNRSSSADLLKVERIALPLTLLILLLVFRAPLAAALALGVAIITVAAASAALYLASDMVPVSVFAQNAIAIVGLGIGVDYSLIVLSRFREELLAGKSVRAAVEHSATAAGRTVLVAGIVVGIGFLSLLLVRARFIHSIALGGFLGVACAVTATLTLLPVLLLKFGDAINWPELRSRVRSASPTASDRCGRWVDIVMRRPWHFALPALLLTGALALPAFRMTPINSGVRDLPPQHEARTGFDALERNFDAGWMGPVAVLVESAPGARVDTVPARQAIDGLAARLAADARVARVVRDPRLATSPDGAAALFALVTRSGPDAAETVQLVRDLRTGNWPEAARAGLRVSVGGPTAMMADFDAELFASLWRVIPVVLSATFLVLSIAYRSLVLPLKAIVLNLFSVLAAYGFLVLLFQDGVGSSLIDLEAPGGLNSLVVLMLFTILFGISMDYEVLLLSRVRENYCDAADNRRAVAIGVGRSARVITGAAAIMVTLFVSLGFTRFTATREFGLGLALAVAFDATLVRLVLAPALMELFGKANWWWPTGCGVKGGDAQRDRSLDWLDVLAPREGARAAAGGGIAEPRP